MKGHDHVYVTQKLDGIVYQTLPQPSHAGDKETQAADYGYVGGNVVGGSGFLKVNADQNQATVTFVKFDGSTADTYSILG